MSPLQTRLAAWLAVLPALASLLIAADIFHPAPTTACACTRDTAASPPPAPDLSTPSLALRPGAHLADPKILSLTSPSPALRQAVQDLTGTAPGHSQQPGSTSPGGSTRTPATHTPGHASSHPAASAIPPSRTPAQGDSTPTGQPSASAFPSATLQPSSPATASTATSTATSRPPQSPQTGHFTLAQVLGAAALLAATLTGALATRRILRRHHRKHGATPDHATHASNPPPLLRSASEPDSTARLDLALRTLAHHAAQEENGKLPAVRAVRVGSRTLQVLPDDPAEGPRPPFTPGVAQGWWELPADAQLLAPEPAHQVPAPYPALITIGHASDDALVLVNLAHIPALLLEGDPVRIAQVCTCLALEHAMSPWADGADILAIGFGETLPHLLPDSGISHTRHPARALQELTERLLEAHQHPGLPHRPCLILSATALDTDTVHQVADLIEGTRTVPVTLIAPASTARALFPHAVILNAADSQPQHLDLIGADITLQRVDDTAYAQITTALAHTRQPPKPATATDEPSPQTTTGLSRRDVAHPAGHAARAEAASVETPGHDDGRAGTPSQLPVPAPGAGSDDAVFAALLAAEPERPPHPRHAAVHQSPASSHDGAPSGTPPQAHRPPAQDRDHRLTGVAAPAGIGDPHAPEIRVLGPLDVDGVPHTGHGPKTAQLAALMYFRPGRTADALCTDMDPTTPWTATTLNARLHQLRRALGNTPEGQPYVPRRTNADDPYRLHPDIRCDWTAFRHLTQHTLTEEENVCKHVIGLQCTDEKWLRVYGVDLAPLR
ncbi:hypothetical protein AB0I54_47620 [Streptomyces sp. NPDC050625]|uniref:hypothetical protein n=1 Tax=Streptomyces sp. NPDC050625 TaxID=3154629 RepID=UPI003422EB3E